MFGRVADKAAAKDMLGPASGFEDKMNATPTPASGRILAEVGLRGRGGSSAGRQQLRVGAHPPDVIGKYTPDSVIGAVPSAPKLVPFSVRNVGAVLSDHVSDRHPLQQGNVVNAHDAAWQYSVQARWFSLSPFSPTR